MAIKMDIHDLARQYRRSIGRYDRWDHLEAALTVFFRFLIFVGKIGLVCWIIKFIFNWDSK